MLLAVNQLIEEKQLTEADVEFRLIGNSRNELQPYLEGFQYPNILTIVDKVPRFKALEMMVNTDVQLLIQNLEGVSSETIPSKLYEYLQVGKPILGLIYQNLELSEILEQREHYTAGADDVAAIKDQILKIYGQWKIGSLKGKRKLSPILVQDSVEELVALFQNQLGASQISNVDFGVDGKSKR